MSKLLLLTPQLPYPPHQGTSLRNFHIIRGLADRHEITLLSFHHDDKEQDPVENGPLHELCQQVFTVKAPTTRSTSERLAQMLVTRLPDMALRLDSRHFGLSLKGIMSRQDFDIVQVEGIEMAWLITVIRQVNSSQRIVYDAHNAEALLQYRALQADIRTVRRWPAAAYSWVQQHRLRKFEKWIGENVDWITTVSQVDKENLASQIGQERISVVPNCIDVREYAYQTAALPEGKDERKFDLVFIGKMDYRPNVDAVIWFADAVWPQIAAERKNTTWAIVGQKPHARLARLQDVPGITVTGWVEKVQPYLAGSRVFIMPFRVGSGTRLKLIEALAAGKAVVSTSLGVEGYPVENGRELELADSAAEMAAKILRLLEDRDSRHQLGINGRKFAERYDWRQIIPSFDEVYDKIK